MYRLVTRGWHRQRIRGLHAIFEVGQRSGRASLKEHVHKTILRPNEQCSAMVGTLETRAFVTSGFRQPLLIGRRAIQRTSRQDFTVLNRQRPEFHRVVIRVDPLIDVSRTIGNFDHLKFVVASAKVAAAWPDHHRNPNLHPLPHNLQQTRTRRQPPFKECRA